MDTFVPAAVMGFREGLEAFLIIGIMLRVLTQSSAQPLKNSVWAGAWTGVGVSLLFGWILFAVGRMSGQQEGIAKVWESAASLVAMVFVTTFILWMIRHGHDMASEVRKLTSQNLRNWSLFGLALIMVSREGVEIAVFAFAGKYSLIATSAGILSALVLTTLVMRSIVKVPLVKILQITLVYLILQAGYLTGYGIHEGLSSLKYFGLLSQDSPLLWKAFDLSKGVFAHKDGLIGLPLNVLIGWYSKPEWIQITIQLVYASSLLVYWRRLSSRLTGRN